MSRHWRPDWTVIDGSAPVAPPKVRGRAAVVVLGIVFVGVAGWLAWERLPRPAAETPPPSPIEWNAVQAVPTRTPDAEDVEWQKRAAAADTPVIGSPAAEAGQPSSDTVTGRIYVIDGDTFSVGGKRIRIAGMDAPETHPSRCMEEARLGLAATAKLKELLASGTVTMSGSGHDQYGRELRQVSVNGVDVADVMISAGLASSYDGGKKQGWC